MEPISRHHPRTPVIPHTDWLRQAPENPSDMAFAVPAGIRLLLGIRPDIAHLKTDQLLDRIAVYAWWESDSRKDYAEMEWTLTPADLDALRGLHADELFTQGGRGFTRLLRGNWPSVLDLVPGFTARTREVVVDETSFIQALPQPLRLIWADRPDLQASYDITQVSGRIGLLMWWFGFGHKEYVRVAWRVDASLRQLRPHGPQGTFPLPLFLSLIVQGRDDLRNLYPLDTETGWLAALIWWEQNGFHEFAVPSWSLRNHMALRSQLAQKSAAFDATRHLAPAPCARPLPYLPCLIWSARADLKAAFDLGSAAGCDGLEAWWKANGPTEYTAVISLFEDPASQLPGLNIVGYAQSVIGIAEDVRMAARSAQVAGLPCCVIDAPMPGPARLDHTLDAQMVTAPVHPVSLYCLPPTEMIRLGMEGGRSLLTAGTYNIGAWHWELPAWPGYLAGVHQMVDEIWVFSEYVGTAFARLGDKPVRRMPLAVELPAIAGPDRNALGLPADKFLFLVMFDGNSWLSRKNPVGAVRAFKAAFPADRGVGLVIKAMGQGNNAAGWQAMLTEIAGDDRVVVIDQTLSRPDVTRLMASCDAYVSLHRSEGFGRIIAEAMLLGVPTVVTDFSGNADFCTADTSYLVCGERVPLDKDEYLFADGQFWCDPDLSLASRQMVRLREDQAERTRLAANAQKNIAENYSIEAVARAYKTRLQQLRQDHRI
jgi:glycosyltransferase involved in cell wall biosynthesis